MLPAVTTRSYDNARTGTTTDERLLTPQSVGTRGVRRAFSLTMTGDQRGKGKDGVLYVLAQDNMGRTAGQLRVLWDSQDWNLTFSHNKFNRPIVFKGRVYVPTYDDRVDVYELT